MSKRPTTRVTRTEVEFLLEYPDAYGILEQVFGGEVKRVRPFDCCTAEVIATHVDRTNVRWEADLQHGRLPFMLAEREKSRDHLRGVLANYIKAKREAGVSSTDVQHLFKLAQGCAIPIFFHDRFWWNSYLSNELDAEARAIVDSMIYAPR